MTNVFDGKLNIIFLNISFPLLEFKVPFRLSLKILKQLSSITLIYSSLGIGCYSRATARCSYAIIPISRHICFFPLPPKVLLAPFEQEIFFSLANRPMIFFARRHHTRPCKMKCEAKDPRMRGFPLVIISNFLDGWSNFRSLHILLPLPGCKVFFWIKSNFFDKIPAKALFLCGN